MSSAPSIGQRLSCELRRTRLTLELLIERRLLALLFVDVLLLLNGLVVTLSTNGEPASIYLAVVLTPFLVLGIPILSNAVALERRSGALELVLVSPRAHSFFVRRIASFCAVLTLQGWVVMTLAWFIPSRPFELPLVLIQILVVAMLLGSVALFWNLMLRSSGAVMVAMLLTLFALGRWVLDNPIPPPAEGTIDLSRWIKTNLLLALTSVVFYLYAAGRLRRTEAILD